MELGPAATEVWEKAAKHYKTSYLAWTLYTDCLMYVEFSSADCHLFANKVNSRNNDYTKATTVFKEASFRKNLDYPEAIWEGWLNFEHLHGSLQSLEACLDQLEKAQRQVSERRAKVCYFSVCSDKLF
jgi:squamous cell carcinoma antigen recognized by T-cells 3